MRLLVAGDFCPFGYTEELFKKKDYSKVFSEVSPVFAEADYSVVNLETPVLRNGSRAKPIAKCGPALRTDESCLEALSYLGVSCVTLANNHFRDFGDNGCIDTISLLDSFNISHVGGGKDLKDASATLVINFDEENVVIINCCEHEFSIASDSSAGSNPLNPITQYYQIKKAKEERNYVVVIVHGGLEYLQYPSLRMINTYRFFIDAGADVVVNHHQHCYSGFEVYKGKPIFYGLGNFCFDWQERPGCWYDGYMVMISLNNTISFQIIPFCQSKNGSHRLELIKGDDVKLFNDSIDQINHNLHNETFIEKVNKEFLDNNILKYQMAFEPYNSRIMKKLFRMKMLPTLLRNDKRLQLLNFIECESHIPGVINYLSSRD